MAKAKKTKKECFSEDAYNKLFMDMEKKLKKSYGKLKQDITKKASLTTIKKDSHELLLLLGELNYLEKECKKFKRK